MPHAAQVFISYHPADQLALEQLEKHLKPLQANGLIDYWHNGLALAGADLSETRKIKLSAADIVLLLVSPDFVSSIEHEAQEVKPSIKRARRNKLSVIPILIRSSLWNETLYKDYRPLPKNSQPVSQWKNHDEAWVDVVTGLKVVAEKVCKRIKLLSKWYGRIIVGVFSILTLIWILILKKILTAISSVIAFPWHRLITIYKGSKVLSAITYAGTVTGIGVVIYLGLKKPGPELHDMPDLATPADGSVRVEADMHPPLPIEAQEPGMIKIMGGAFMMGSPDYSDERKPHEVTVPTFWIDETEVTAEDFARYVSLDPKKRFPQHVGKRRSCNFINPKKQKHPMNCVAYDEAENYCKSLDKRLPTEAEWEYAARGREHRTYPWGPESPEDPGQKNRLCWVRNLKNGNLGTCEVGSVEKDRTEAGVKDLAGNVREWVDGWYCPDGYEDELPPKNGSNQTGCSHDKRVVRGHSWGTDGDHTRHLRASSRHGFPPQTSYDTLGFRCAKSVILR